MSKQDYTILWNNEDTFTSEPNQMECPYCSVDNDLSGHEEMLWQDDDAFLTVCHSCEKEYSVIPSVSWSYSAYQIEKVNNETA